MLEGNSVFGDNSWSMEMIVYGLTTYALQNTILPEKLKNFADSGEMLLLKYADTLQPIAAIS